MCDRIWTKLLLVAFFLVSYVLCAGCTQENKADTSFLPRASSLENPHLRPMGESPIDGANGDMQYRFAFGYTGVPHTLIGIPARQALHYAAACYALATNDYTVSIQDITNAGFWPYKIKEIDDEIERIISEDNTYIVFKENEINSINSSEWLLNVKSEILLMFYYDYYFDLYNERHYCESSVIVPPDELDLIPAFFLSPITNAPFKFGELAGELHEAPFYCLSAVPEELSAPLSRDDLVVLISTHDLVPMPGRYNGRYADGSLKSVSEGELPGYCCFYRRLDDIYYAGDFIYRMKVECPCSGGGSATCYLQWTWSEGGQEDAYEWAGIDLCSLAPMEGYLIINCGADHEIYYYAATGSTAHHSSICEECPGGGIPNVNDCINMQQLLQDIYMAYRVFHYTLECRCS